MSFRNVVWPALLCLAVFAALIALGNWQMRRLDWKEALIASVKERPDLPPIDWRDEDQRAPAYRSGFAQDFSYRRIRLDGEFQAEKEARVFTSLPAVTAKGPASGPGYLIMTPFQLAGQDHAVWVNRGFVPDGARWSPPPEGPVTIIGLIRPDDPAHWLRPQDKPEQNLFFSRSVKALAEAKQLPTEESVDRFTVDLLPPPGGPALPQAGETPMVFTNNHLAYAVTWYGLAAALLAVFASFVWSGWRDGPPRLTQPGHDP